MTVVGLLLLKHCVFKVDLFPDLGRSEFARDVSGDDVVVRCRGCVLIKRSDSAGERDNLDYGRGCKA